MSGTRGIDPPGSVTTPQRMKRLCEESFGKQLPNQWTVSGSYRERRSQAPVKPVTSAEIPQRRLTLDLELSSNLSTSLEKSTSKATGTSCVRWE